jgi:hypothetical protein
MDNIIAKAKQRHEALTIKAERLKAELDIIFSEIRELDGFFKVTEKLEAELDPAREAARQTSKRALITNFAQSAISRIGAMTSSMVLDEIDKAGHADWVGGKDRRGRVSNISALLSRDTRFVSDRQAGGYILKANST